LNDNRRKVCVIVTNRASYGRIRSVMEAIREHPRLQLQLIVGASALLYRFGMVVDIIRRDGFEPDATLYSIVEGETPVTMAKSTGMSIMEMATLFDNLRPDVCLTVADRFETLATAVAASYMNLPLAHTQGGEITGSIDESVRHAITKLAHVHFPATEQAAEYLVRMGERPERVFHTGCPSIDAIATLDLSLPPDLFQRYGGVGARIDPKAPYLVVLQHPVTTEYGQGMDQIRHTLEAVHRTGMQTVWLWPNVDAGSDHIAKGLREFREERDASKLHFFRNFAVEDYARLIVNCACLVGNSSSALREGAFLGVPAVNIGTRQTGRECGENVLHVGHDAAEIHEAIQTQIAHGPHPRNTMFGDGCAGARIAEVLATVDIQVQKSLAYSPIERTIGVG